ncbi:MAG: 2Fe-2S iron-sulfur cluster-binding protein [Pseudomonadota bacterium]
MSDDDVTRREFMETAGVVAASLPWLAASPAGAQDAGPIIDGASDVSMVVNGEPRTARIAPNMTLLDTLREELDLTGTKKGCNQGGCGACTIWIDGERANACMTLAIMHEGREITTIEALANGDDLHPLQRAFIENDAFQCGFCTSGQIMSGVKVLEEGLPATEAGLTEAMNGNICRCSAYPQIRAALRDVAGKG